MSNRCKIVTCNFQATLFQSPDEEALGKIKEETQKLELVQAVQESLKHIYQVEAKKRAEVSESELRPGVLIELSEISGQFGQFVGFLNAMNLVSLF